MAVNEGFQALAQSHISKGIAANYWKRDPLLFLLASMSGANSKPTGLEIGRPSGNVFSGTKLDQIQKRQIQGANSYKPGFGIQNPVNTKIQGARDTQPTVANPTTNSHGQLRGTAEVFWTGLISEPILIYDSDLDRAVRSAGRDSEGRGIARAQVLKEAVDLATQNVNEKVSSEIWTGSPTDQDSDPLDHLIGIPTWFSATNYCARVDRSVAKNAQWRSQVDSNSRPAVFADLLDYANIDLGLLDYGPGASLCICNNAQYKAFKKEILGSGGMTVQNEMPKMGEYGVEQEVLRKDNCFVMRAAKCPANTCYFFDLRVWKWITMPGKSFTVTPFKELWYYTEGAKRAWQAFVELQSMLVCDNPFLNVAFTGVVDPS